MTTQNAMPVGMRRHEAVSPPYREPYRDSQDSDESSLRSGSPAGAQRLGSNDKGTMARPPSRLKAAISRCRSAFVAATIQPDGNALRNALDFHVKGTSTAIMPGDKHQQLAPLLKSFALIAKTTLRNLEQNIPLSIDQKTFLLNFDEYDRFSIALPALIRSESRSEGSGKMKLLDTVKRHSARIKALLQCNAKYLSAAAARNPQIERYMAATFTVPPGNSQYISPLNICLAHKDATLSLCDRMHLVTHEDREAHAEKQIDMALTGKIETLLSGDLAATEGCATSGGTPLDMISARRLMTSGKIDIDQYLSVRSESRNIRPFLQDACNLLEQSELVAGPTSAVSSAAAPVIECDEVADIGSRGASTIEWAAGQGARSLDGSDTMSIGTRALIAELTANLPERTIPARVKRTKRVGSEARHISFDRAPSRLSIVADPTQAANSGTAARVQQWLGKLPKFAPPKPPRMQASAHQTPTPIASRPSAGNVRAIAVPGLDVPAPTVVHSAAEFVGTLAGRTPASAAEPHVGRSNTARTRQFIRAMYPAANGIPEPRVAKLIQYYESLTQSAKSAGAIRPAPAPLARTTRLAGFDSLIEQSPYRGTSLPSFVKTPHRKAIAGPGGVEPGQLPVVASRPIPAPRTNMMLRRALEVSFGIPVIPLNSMHRGRNSRESSF